MIVTALVLCYGEGRNKSTVGIYYTQTSVTLFSWGLVQEKEFNRLPVIHQLSLGYVYDNRSNKKYGHGVVIDWGLAPFFSIKDYKLGPFFGIGVLLEAYMMKEIDFYFRERDIGINTGVLSKGWEHVYLKAGVNKYFSLSKFFTLWEPYQSRFSFTVGFTL